MDISLRNRYFPKVQHISLVQKPRNKSSSLPKKGKLNQKTSYYQEKELRKSNNSRPQSLDNTKNSNISFNSSFFSTSVGAANYQKQISFQELQEKVDITDYSEYDVIQENSVILTILTNFNPQNPLVFKNEESEDRFLDKKVQIIDEIQKKFPFIKIIEKQEDDEEIANQSLYGLFEIQLCTYFNKKIEKFVIYSKKMQQVLPKIKYVTENIRQAFQSFTCNLTVQVDCMLKNINPVGKSALSKENNFLEGLGVILTQKDQALEQNLPFNHLFSSQSSFTTTFFTKSQLTSKSGFQSRGNLQFQSSMNSSLCKQTFHGTVQDSFLRSHSRAEKMISPAQKKELEKIHQIQPQAQRVAKKTSRRGVTDENGTLKIKNIIKLVGDYEISIYNTNNKNIKPYKTTINLQQLSEQQGTQDLKVNCFIERDDVQNGNIMLYDINSQEQIYSYNTTVKFANYKFYDEKYVKNPSLVPQDSQIYTVKNEQIHSFHIAPEFYYIEIQKEGYYPQYREILVKKNEFNLEISLTKSNLHQVNFQVLDIMTKNIISSSQLEVYDKSTGQLVAKGEGDEQGRVKIQASLMKTVEVKVKSEKYINMSYQFQLNSNHVFKSKVIDIFMIPFFEQKNSLEILVFQPHNQFKINFQIQDTQNQMSYSTLDKDTNNNVVMQFEQPATQYYNKQSKLVSFSVQDIDKFGQVIFKGFSNNLQAPNQGGKKNISINTDTSSYLTENSCSSSSNNNNNNVRNSTTLKSCQNKSSSKGYFSASGNKTSLGLNKNSLNIQPFSVNEKQQQYSASKPSSTKNNNFSTFENLSILKSVQNTSNFFLKKRVSVQKEQKYIPKNFNYINEKIAQYNEEDSMKVYILGNNKIIDMISISQNLFASPKDIFYYSGQEKKLNIVYEKKADIVIDLSEQIQKSARESCEFVDQENNEENQVPQKQQYQYLSDKKFPHSQPSFLRRKSDNSGPINLRFSQQYSTLKGV